MQKDKCIVLDAHDRVVGYESKYETHRFNETTERGILHRAFSVFLFNKEGKLLLQQRASDKITFPDVWTNTCCSHPLTGFTPTEVDTPLDVALGRVPGVKRAAVRKLKHELGVEEGTVPVESFKFLTRLHYWAADVVTHGKQSPWGEHEIDYILFARVDGLDFTPNPEEVRDTKWVTLQELRDMMKPESGLLWSPWFRIIVERFLPAWWADLDETLGTDRHVDVRRIHRFDPTTEHMGGGGDAGPWLDTGVAVKVDVPEALRGAASLKQGAYGKIPIHKEGKLAQLTRLDEVFSAVHLMTSSKRILRNKIVRSDPDVAFCDDILGKVSRSFAAVIRQLPAGLCLDVLVFYIVLRALDTVEDDMVAFASNDVKCEHLRNFYRTALAVSPKWTMSGVGEGDEALLLEKFDAVARVFSALPAPSQEVIGDITRRMGEGMAEFVDKDLGQGTTSVEEYNRYCHFVAGLVGEGLSRLFVISGADCGSAAGDGGRPTYEDPAIGPQLLALSNSMGLFLQKTNIIRDYLEDFVDGRAFWPQEIWNLYAKRSLGEFALPENRDKALMCLNHLVTDALELVPDCLSYLELLRNKEVFRFCAIPQVMAIATLEKCFNNPDVFTGVVKIRKGLSCRLILASGDLDGVDFWFFKLAQSIMARANRADPNFQRTAAAVDAICERTAARYSRAKFTFLNVLLNAIAPVGALLCAACLHSRKGGADSDGSLLPRLTNPTDVAILGLLFACIVYLLGFATVSTAATVRPLKAAN